MKQVWGSEQTLHGITHPHPTPRGTVPQDPKEKMPGGSWTESQVRDRTPEPESQRCEPEQVTYPDLGLSFFICKLGAARPFTSHVQCPGEAGAQERLLLLLPLE